MEPIRLLHAPEPADATVRALAEMVAAIELVAAGTAHRIVLAGLPAAELVAREALAQAQAAGVPFRLERASSRGIRAVVVGPIER